MFVIYFSLLGIIFFILLVSFYFSDFTATIIPTINNYNILITNFIEDYENTALIIFSIIYLLSMTTLLPLAGIIVFFGGFYFGWIVLPISVICVSIGSLVPFYLGKFFSDKLLKGYKKYLEKIKINNFNNQILAVTIMRIVPWAPFSITTLISGALSIKSSNFLIGTALGFLPYALALIELGKGLASILQFNDLSLHLIFSTTSFQVGIIALFLLFVISKYLKFTLKG